LAPSTSPVDDSFTLLGLRPARTDAGEQRNATTATAAAIEHTTFLLYISFDSFVLPFAFF
jgi:hypothetical protein